MELKQFYLSCLAHASYLVGSDGECAIVDPQRDVQQYLDAADLRGWRIKYVIETHLHADFVSGHRELAARAGAEIVFGRLARAAFPHRAVKDGDELVVGRVRLRILETPGHTPESISIVVVDEASGPEPKAVLTGDTLFIGDVGRPDLVAAAGHSPAEMAGMLYDSLHGKLLALPDEVEVYPAHGAGSLCGRNISSELSSTIGAQRRQNLALQPMPRERFIELMTTGLPEQPRYFAMDARLNREGPSEILGRPLPLALAPSEVAARLAGGAVVLDVRTVAQYGEGHVPGSFNIGLSGQFASWAGTLLPLDRPIVLVTDNDAQAEEAQLRLARVGIENLEGRLVGGIAAWQASGFDVATTPQVNVKALAEALGTADAPQVLDVRRSGEHAAGHVPGALNVPLDGLAQASLNLDPSRPLAVICQGGYRSSAALGILEGLGFKRLTNVVGGTGAWVQAGLAVEGSPGASCAI